jgi:hypothetical protein
MREICLSAVAESDLMDIWRYTLDRSHVRTGAYCMDGWIRRFT